MSDRSNVTTSAATRQAGAPPVVGMVGSRPARPDDRGGGDRPRHRVPGAGGRGGRERRSGLRRHRARRLPRRRRPAGLRRGLRRRDLRSRARARRADRRTWSGAGVAVRPGSRALRFAQDKLAMRQRGSSALGLGVPAVRRGRRPGRGDGVRRRARLAGGAQGAVGRLRRQGRLGAARHKPRRPRCCAHGIALLAEEHVAVRRASSPCWSRGRPAARALPTRSSRPCSATGSAAR